MRVYVVICMIAAVFSVLLHENTAEYHIVIVNSYTLCE